MLADIEAVCTRLVILYGGRLLREGTVAELLTIQDQMLLRVPRLAPALTVERVVQVWFEPKSQRDDLDPERCPISICPGGKRPRPRARR